MKDIKDYLPFYIGSDYRVSYIETPSTFTVWSKLNTQRLARLDDLSIVKIQLRLRPLSDISKKEMEERSFSSKRHWDDWCDYNKDKWPTEDLLWLLKNSFDVFDLIAEGLAIDATKLKTTQP